jgi:quercetin dioxygenase-like cupin family protein
VHLLILGGYMAKKLFETARFIPEGSDRFSQDRGVGISALRYKVATDDSDGRLLLIEQSMHAKGGPARHLHLDQEEWFYSVHGEFILEVGDVKYTLTAGVSLLAPRQVPHVWAYVGEGVGRLLIAFTPAGKMEAFFNEITKQNAMPPQDPVLWREHGMELVGPPLQV